MPEAADAARHSEPGASQANTDGRAARYTPVGLAGTRLRVLPLHHTESSHAPAYPTASATMLDLPIQSSAAHPWRRRAAYNRTATTCSAEDSRRMRAHALESQSDQSGPLP